jgi:hypothetical protein
MKSMGIMIHALNENGGDTRAAALAPCRAHFLIRCHTAAEEGEKPLTRREWTLSLSRSLALARSSKRRHTQLSVSSLHPLNLSFSSLLLKGLFSLLCRHTQLSLLPRIFGAPDEGICFA